MPVPDEISAGIRPVQKRDSPTPNRLDPLPGTGAFDDNDGPNGLSTTWGMPVLPYDANREETGRKPGQHGIRIASRWATGRYSKVPVNQSYITIRRLFGYP